MLRVIDGSRDLIDADVSVTYCAAHAVPEYVTHSRSLPSLFIDLVSPWGGGGETICSPTDGGSNESKSNLFATNKRNET